MSSPKRTALYNFHQEHRARFVEFGGWEMPVQYTGILEEHRMVRQSAGLFDVSHMGEVNVTGPLAEKFLNYLVTNDVAKLKNRQAQYTVMCNEDGGVVDDLLIYRLKKDSYMLCVNANNTESDYDWIRENAASFNCEVENVSADYTQLALQGPLALSAMAPLTVVKLEEMPPFSIIDAIVAGVPAMISRTGYTGEEGVEIYCPWDVGSTIARSILDAGKYLGIGPCGLGARDSLRLEAGFSLYGHEITESISPLEARLGWTVKLNKEGDFIGKEALAAEKARGSSRRIVFFHLDGRRIARPGTPVIFCGKKVGEVVSGSFSPIINQPIGSALVSLNGTDLQSLEVDLRGHLIPLQVKKPPLHK